jgi:hypothetical protein
MRYYNIKNRFYLGSAIKILLRVMYVHVLLCFTWKRKD